MLAFCFLPLGVHFSFSSLAQRFSNFTVDQNHPGCLLECGFWGLNPKGCDLVCLKGGCRNLHFNNYSKWLWWKGVQRPPFEKCCFNYSEIRLQSDNPQSENCWGILQFECCVALSYRALTQCEVNNVEHSINTVVHRSKMSTFQVFSSKDFLRITLSIHGPV